MKSTFSKNTDNPFLKDIEVIIEYFNLILINLLKIQLQTKLQAKNIKTKKTINLPFKSPNIATLKAIIIIT